MKKSYLKSSTFLYLKGCFVGLSFIVPGVSGGTAALITHLYNPLIQWVNQIRTTLFLKDSLAFLSKSTIELMPVFLGILSGFFLTVYWMSYLLLNYPVQVFCFFSGAILSSIPIIYKEVKIGWSSILISLLSMFFAFGLVLMPVPTFELHLIWFLFSVYLAVAAMLLPGVSGSYLLIVMGTYFEFLDLFKHFSFTKLVMTSLVSLLSLFTVSMWIQWLLKNYKSGMMASLIGLTIGGALGVFPFKSLYMSTNILLQGILYFVVGLSLSLFFYRISNKK